jgi:hypothetical protein
LRRPRGRRGRTTSPPSGCQHFDEGSQGGWT